MIRTPVDNTSSLGEPAEREMRSHGSSRPHPGRRGFTLIEMVVVVGLVAIVGSIAVYNITRIREQATVEKALVNMRFLVERAQTLSAIAGSRITTPARVTYGGLCPGAPPGGGANLWITIAPNGDLTVPASVTYDENTDQLTVECMIWNVGTFTEGSGTVDLPAVATTFAFSPNGRILMPGTPNPSVFIRLRHATSERTYGLRVLTSGYICAATDPANNDCDEDV